MKNCCGFRANLWHGNDMMFNIQRAIERVVLRWWRYRTGRPLSPPQIHQENISALSKFHKTTECWQRTSGTQKSSPLSSKGGRKNIKDKKRGKRGRDGSQSHEFSAIQFSSSVVSTLQPHELQHPRPPCPSPTIGVHSNSHPSTR